MKTHSHLPSDYRDSHKAPEKALGYECRFQEFGYRKYIWSWEKKVLQTIVEDILEDSRAIDYLDFACGTGRVLAFLEDRVAAAFGVDIADSMLEIAKQKVKRSELINVDLTRHSPFPNERFDLITAFRFFLNAQPELREQAMTVLAGLLKPDGRLVFNVHMNRSCLIARMVQIKRRILRRDPSAFAALGFEEITQLTRQSGLRIVKTYHRGVVPIIRENAKIAPQLAHPIEAVASHIPAMCSLARYVIYVCQRQ